MCLHEEVELLGEFGTVYKFPCVYLVYSFFFWVLSWGKGFSGLVLCHC